MAQEQYYDKVFEILQKARDTQSGTVRELAAKVAGIFEKGGILYVFGSGHSHMLAEEISARAGGLIQVKALLPYELIMDLGSGKSTLVERMDGYASILMAVSHIRPQDALVVVSNSGRNAVPVQLAREAKAMGVLTIALTNVEHSSSVSSREAGGQRLYEVCDYVLDTCGVPGDATVPVKDRPYQVGPTSTIAGCMLLQGLVSEVCDLMVDQGFEPPVLQSANMDGNDDRNKAVTEELYRRWPDLKYLLK